jgi:hypothetical protein
MGKVAHLPAPADHGAMRCVREVPQSDISTCLIIVNDTNINGATYKSCYRTDLQSGTVATLSRVCRHKDNHHFAPQRSVTTTAIVSITGSTPIEARCG